VEYLKKYAEDEKMTGKNIDEFIDDILRSSEEVQDILEKIMNKTESTVKYFEPLQESENNKKLSRQKGKIKQNRLRLYAIKIDNCFVITGGAIKMSQKMDEHFDTKKELNKLKKAKSYFSTNGVFDEDSFFELLIEDIS